MRVSQTNLVNLGADRANRERRMADLYEELSGIIYEPEGTKDLMAMDVIGVLETLKNDYHLRAFWADESAE
jgi:hypothetical protein